MNYVAATVALKSEAARAEVQEWFEKLGFQTMRMKVGWLISGDEDLFLRVFRVSDDKIRARKDGNVTLDTPPAIANLVDSIWINQLPSLHS